MNSSHGYTTTTLTLLEDDLFILEVTCCFQNYVHITYASVLFIFVCNSFTLQMLLRILEHTLAKEMAQSFWMMWPVLGMRAD